MVPVGKALAPQLCGLLVLLGCLRATGDVDGAGLAAGALSAVLVGVAVGVAAARSHAALGLADHLTLVRATIACAMAGLTTESWLGHPHPFAVVALAVVALCTDALDGAVARRTGTTTSFGARLDGEVDAFLLLVLSAYVMPAYGAWVLAIGLARYAFAVAGLIFPRLRVRLPPRYWRKVVTAVQGVVLTYAAAGVGPRVLTELALALAVGLLAESFGRDVLWLSRRPRRETDDRASYDSALQRARLAAFPPGEFVGQESFMRAGEILRLATRAGVGPGAAVLDLCCGVAGPGRFVTAELGCSYLGVDSSPAAVGLARERAGRLPCRFTVSAIPPLPPGRFDVVLLLETLLAFPDKAGLLRRISSSLREGGRLALTFEEGAPLTAAEREAMPNADTVWLVRLPELLADLELARLEVGWIEDCTEAHRETADELTRAFVADEAAIADRLGREAYAELLAAHLLWSRWLRQGRARKFALVAEKSRARPEHHPAVTGAHLD